MQISPTDLSNEFKRARKSYPVIEAAEKQLGLPQFLLFAIGSRETNLTNEVGDFGHGHGMFQLDDRSHTIPPGFDKSVTAQATKAADMMKSLIHHYPGDLKAACAAYNTGTGNVDAGIRDTGNPDAYTTGHNYGADVIGRMMYLQNHYGSSPIPVPFHPKPIKQRIYTVKSGDNLSIIGKKFRVSWQKIYRANRSTIGSNPNLIFPGEKLIIPRKVF